MIYSRSVRSNLDLQLASEVEEGSLVGLSLEPRDLMLSPGHIRIESNCRDPAGIRALLGYVGTS